MNFGEGKDRLPQKDVLIAQTREAAGKEATGKAKEERQRAEREAARLGNTLENLEQLRYELAAEIAVRQTHLKTSAEEELLRLRADRLRSQLAELLEEAAAIETELTGINTG